MSGWTDSQDCPNCGGVDSLKTYGETRPYDTVGGECVECGFAYSTEEKQMSLDEVNEIRENYDLEPLTELKPALT